MPEFPSESIGVLKRQNGPGEHQNVPEDEGEPQDDETGSAPGYYDRLGSTAEPGTENRIPVGSRRRPWPMATDGDFAVKGSETSDRPQKPNPLPKNDPFPQVHVALLKRQCVSLSTALRRR